MASTLPILMVLVIAAVVFPVKTSGKNDVLDIAEANGAKEFSALARKSPYLQKLLESSAQPNGLTVFAFTDSAYASSPAAFKEFINGTDGLRFGLEYHVSLGLTTSKDLRNNLLLTSVFPSPMGGSSLPPQFIRINIYTIPSSEGELNSVQTVTATGAPIIHPDLQASNGIVHIINKVMFPIPMGVNMPDFLKKDPRFSLLFSFLTKANLTGALATDPSKPLTIFAPNDAAFKKLPKAVVDKLANVTFLQEVLEYHVVNAALYAAGLYDNQKLVPLAGGTILVLIGPGGVFVDNEQVIQTDTTVVNGVIHEVSGVLIPPAK
ncbi:transforming growth factor-beta-induced protein ig-h3-like isoform X2 [Asterias amurensis]|uniref:transforming growth factor-beta-induced protein ig-h3-like isoform X2 n=1 Tax=Asterias amurensis TaxID=7602 RepID=UPI003AB7F866